MKIQTIGRYEIISTLGSGAMGMVYKARDPELNREVAIKTLKNAIRETGIEADKAIERFRNEARSAGALRHPNLITVFEASVDGLVPYIVMDYIDGTSFDELLETNGKLLPEAALSFLSQIASGLDYAHEKNVLHGDIKPSNIIIDHDNNAILVDFGLAQSQAGTTQRSDGTLSATRFGTPEYLAPEQAMGRELDRKSDLFSLAIVAYECLAGELPFKGESPEAVLEAVVNQEPLPISLVSGLSPALDPLFMRALAKSKDHRFLTASLFIMSIGDALGIHRIEKLAPGSHLKAQIIVPFDDDPEVDDTEAAKAEEKGATSPTPIAAQTQEITATPVSASPEVRQSIPTGELLDQRVEIAQVGRKFGEGKLETKHGSVVQWLGIIFVLLVGIGTLGYALTNSSLAPASDASVQVAEVITPSVATPQVESEITARSEAAMSKEVGSVEELRQLSSEELLATIRGRNTDEVVIEAMNMADALKVPGLNSALTMALRRNSLQVQVEALKLLGKHRVEASLSEVLPLLFHQDPLVRGYAAKTLGRIGSRGAEGFLRERRDAETDENVKMVMSKALLSITGESE